MKKLDEFFSSKARVLPTEIDIAQRPLRSFENVADRPGKPINVAIVDDDSTDRLLLERIVDRSKRLRGVGSYATGEEALRSPALAEARIVLMDVRLPGLSGIDCARMLKKVVPTLIILMVTAAPEFEALRMSLLVGADGFLNKPLTEADCWEAIRYALVGGLPLAKDMIQKIFGDYRSSAPESSLTARESAILDCMAKGMRNKEIAQELQVPISSLQNWIRNIFTKLHVSNRAEAITQCPSHRIQNAP